MAMYLKPKRGKQAAANSVLSGTGKLKSGEIFFEVPEAGVGKGQGRLMMGDGSTNYGSLKAFLAFDMNNVQTFSNVTSATGSTNDSINSIAPTSTLAYNLNRIKQALLNLRRDLSNAYGELDVQCTVVEKSVLCNRITNPAYYGNSPIFDGAEEGVQFNLPNNPLFIIVLSAIDDTYKYRALVTKRPNTNALDGIYDVYGKGGITYNIKLLVGYRNRSY